MPYAPPRACREPGCPHRAIEGVGVCSHHEHKRRARTEQARPNAYQRGYDRRWAKLRLLVLRRYPICRLPECYAVATEVDHIVPKAQGGDDSMDNLQGLCKRHHSQKTMRESNDTY